MRKLNYLLGLAILSSALIFSSCTKEDDPVADQNSILPTSFSIDVPDAISSNTTNRSTNSDTLDGGVIYGHLRNFIAIGEGAGQIVEGLIIAINIYQIDHAMSLTYTSSEDNREKNLVVIEGSSFEGVSYEFKMTITDAQSEGNADGGKALQIFWNRSPVVGVAILKPYNVNRDENQTQQNAIFRIDYSEASSYGYDKHMIVSISGLSNDQADPYYVDNLKMFVGKTGDIIEVYGNSNHPNANFFTNETGFNWAFVAASDKAQNIGVAEVGLPSNTLNSNSRNEILVTNSLQTVFNNQIVAMGYDQADVDRYLYNTNAPGYFNNGGFVQGGIAPNTSYNIIEEKISNLTPYNPAEIANLFVNFQ